MRLAEVLAVCLTVASCASSRPDTCTAGARPAVMEAIYFGTAGPDGGVNPEQWQAFVSREIAPRFPEGLSWWPASGQWWNAAGGIEHEAATVLHLVHPDTPENETAIRELISRYKMQFRQEAVLRVRSNTCVSF